MINQRYTRTRPPPEEYWEQDVVCPVCGFPSVTWWDFAHNGGITQCPRHGPLGGRMYPNVYKPLRVRICYADPTWPIELF